MTHNNLNEELSTTAEPNVATTDENLSALQMFQQSTPTSLARQMLPVVPVSGPTAALFYPSRNNDKRLVLKRSEVECYPNPRIQTGLTNEVIQDIQNQFGSDAKALIGNMLRGIADEDENTKMIAFLEANAVASTDLALTSATNAETIVFELGQKLQELVMAANTPFYRTYHAYAVLPWKLAAAFATLSEYVGHQVPDEGLRVSALNTIEVYANPDPASTKVYLGLTSSDYAKSSAVFSPYTQDIVGAMDPDSSETSYDMYNRYAITASALHTPTEPMMFKFTVTA